MKIVPFESWHLEAMEKQPHQAHEAPGEVGGEAYTAFDGDTPIGCGGFMEREGRTFAWAVLADVGPHRFIGIHRAVAARLKRPAEAFVACDFAAGIRWMRLLGFEPAGEIEGFVHYVRTH